MSQSDRPAVCDEAESWGAELALGLLSGPDRAAGLAHLGGCSTCREQVDELARVADRLLLLTPEDEPPAGFESRVLAAVGRAPAAGGAAPGGVAAGAGVAGEAAGEAAGAEGPGGAGVAAGAGVVAGEAGGVGGVGEGGRGRRTVGRRIALVGAAAALMATAAVGGGMVANGLRSDSAPARREPAVVRTGLAVSASGRTSCRVVVSGTRPASVLVSVDGFPGADTVFTVEMETATGAAVPLGPVPVTGGHGLLVGTVDLDAGDLLLMRMFDGEGRVVYEATLEDEPTRR